MTTETLIKKIRDLFVGRRREVHARVFTDWKILLGASLILLILLVVFSVQLFLRTEQGESSARSISQEQPRMFGRTDIEEALAAYRAREATFRAVLQDPPSFVDPSL